MAQLGYTIDPRRIDDEDLVQLRALCLRSTMTVAPKLAEWLHGWCDTEQAVRAGSGERSVQHMLCLPPLAEFTDLELGEALQAAADLHFMPGPPEAVAEILDRILLATAGMAGERLREHAAKR